jgi:colanic acid biosynthesis glycosyl transferase WcaI
MRILLLNQFFWPDSAATSQLLTDLARALASHGYEVHVIAGDGGYANADSGSRPDVHIHRAPTIPFARGSFGRPASYLSFLMTAAWVGMFIPRPDIVVTLTTPPLLSLVGALIKTLRGCTHFIWEMDVYPDIALDLKIMRKSSLIARVTRALADKARVHADGVIALGECMRERLVSHGIPAQRVSVADNWADGRSIFPTSRSTMPAVWSSPDEPLVVLYSGNLGLAHDVDTIYGAMHELSDVPEFRFIFAGSGPRRIELESRCRAIGLTNVEFRAYSSRRQLGESLCDGDIGLVTQIPDTLGSLVPSKIYGLMAAGRPVLFTGPKESTPAHIIRKFHCGWQIDCGDVKGLVRLLFHLKTHPAEVTEAGHRARAAFERDFDLHQGVKRIGSIIGAPLIDVVSTRPVIAH